MGWVVVKCRPWSLGCPLSQKETPVRCRNLLTSPNRRFHGVVGCMLSNPPNYFPIIALILLLVAPGAGRPYRLDIDTGGNTTHDEADDLERSASQCGHRKTVGRPTPKPSHRQVEVYLVQPRHRRRMVESREQQMGDASHMDLTTKFETLEQAEQLIESVYRDIEDAEDPKPEDPRMEQLRKAGYEVRKAIKELDKD